MIKNLQNELLHLSHVFRLFSNRPLDFMKTLFFSQISSLFPVMTGLVIKHIFDQYALGPVNNPVKWTICLFLGLLMSRIFFVFFSAYFGITGRFRLSADMRMNFLEAVLDKPGAESLNLSTGDALNRLKEDVGQIEDFAYGSVVDMIVSGVMVLCTFVILGSINLKMTIFIFLPLVCMVAIMERSGQRISKLRAANRSASGDVSSAIGEMFTNILSIQVNCAEDKVLNHLKHLNRVRATNATKDNVFSQILFTLYENLFNVGTGIILIFMAFFAQGTNFSLGDFVIFTYYMNFISFFIMFAGNAFTRYKQINVSFDHLSQVHHGVTEAQLIKASIFKPDISEMSAEQAPFEELSAKGISFTYPNGQMVVGPLDFTLESGSLTVIAGRIGSGKSTALKLMSGLLEADAGTLYWNDTALLKPSKLLQPPQVAYTPQLPRFFSDTVRENLCLGVKSTESQIADAIHCAVLGPDLDGFSEGIETEIGTSGIKLSGGQQLRLAVGRMFMRQASVYAFDDIASALDVETQHLMWNRILDNRRGTYVVVSNQKRLLEAADQILLMKNGQLEATGRLDDLLQQSEEMRLIYAE